ncbi:MAG: hypothetical protein HC826_00785, partial [Rhodospirillales bacterium]|nr:hypothetical protein [Rhodospirillales bacterium]
DPVDGYRLAAGQWTVDARILIPNEAPPGLYTLSTTFVGDDGVTSFSGSDDFSVF